MARTSKESAKSVAEKKATTQSAVETVSSQAPEQETTVATESAIYRSRCGGALRAAREKQNLSLQEVANRLKMSVKQIEALEADHFDALPEPTIVRGFIRNYAKQLRLNSEPLIDAYTVMVPSSSPYDLTVKSAVNMKMTNGDKPKASIYLWLGLGAVLLAGLWVFYQQYIQKPSPVEPTQVVAEALPKPEPLPEVALPAIDRATIDAMDQALSLHPERTPPNPDSTASAPAAPSTTTAASGTVTTLAVPPVAPASPAVTPDKPAVTPDKPVTTIAEPALVASTTVASLQDASSARLEISAAQETWVNVVDASGKEVYSKILYEGNRELIEAKPPLKLIVGNASATKVTFNGKSQDLAPYTHVNVARITLK
jgi:cytoskeleton protein RodZ